MNINQVHSFAIQRLQDGIVTRIARNTFSTQGDSDAFSYQQIDRRGEGLKQFMISTPTAESSLRKALELQHSRPDLISVEITKLSTGTCFNYPTPFV